MKQKVATFSGEEIYAYTIENGKGMSLTALNFGAAITEINVPDKNGLTENVVINYQDISNYEVNPYYLGIVVGRTSGRTKEGLLKFEDQAIQVEKNDGNNHLHGGIKGLAKSIWEVTEKKDSLIFEYVSPDGEDGYPGTVTFKVSYVLSEDNQVTINYWASPDKKTPINLTNHTYFNLSGNKKTDILNHSLKLASPSFYELDKESMPVRVVKVDDHPTFDFRKGKLVKDVVDGGYEQTDIVGGGIDHPFLLDDSVEEKITLTDPESGRTLTVKTDDPAVVVYSGNQVKQTPTLNGGTAEKYAGICLETQMPPNETESYLIEKGEVYRKQTVFSFNAK
ncbi:aldose epimerase family protein [Salipaludibacillus sp. HK11]|uniref:aldose epimerase family protein n=1 Tax=Salipaludibacillus sp. HK11 TaxID=3394320 RepID=UPI0039FC759F